MIHVTLNKRYTLGTMLFSNMNIQNCPIHSVVTMSIYVQEQTVLVYAEEVTKAHLMKSITIFTDWNLGKNCNELQLKSFFQQTPSINHFQVSHGNHFLYYYNVLFWYPSHTKDLGSQPDSGTTVWNWRLGQMLLLMSAVSFPLIPNWLGTQWTTGQQVDRSILRQGHES